MSQAHIAIPASIQAEHEEIHGALVTATKAPGAVGEKASALAAVMHPHLIPEEQSALPPLALQLRAAGAELAKIELVDEEAARPLEVVHVVVQRLYLADTKGGARRHPSIVTSIALGARSSQS